MKYVLLSGLAITLALAPYDAGAQVVATPANTWIADGGISTIVSQGTTVHLAGNFFRIAPRTGPIVILDRATGVPVTTVPLVEGGDIRDITFDGLGGYVLAGTFTRVGSTTRAGLARITETGALDGSFAPDVTTAQSVVVINNRVFAFANRRLPDGSSTAATLLAFDLFSGALLSWTPAVSLTRAYYRLQAGPVGSLIVSATYPNQVLRLNGTTGALEWSIDSSVTSPLVEGQTGYSRSSFGISRIDLNTGAVTDYVQLRPCDTVHSCAMYPASAMAILNGRLYVTGGFTTVGPVFRSGAVAIDLSNGAVLSWNPPWRPAIEEIRGLFSDGRRILASYGTTENHTDTLAELHPDTGARTGWETYTVRGAVDHVVGGLTGLVIAGSFRAVGGVRRSGLASVTWPTGEPTGWNPAVSGYISALAVVGDRVFVADAREIIEFDATGNRVASAPAFGGAYVLRAHGSRLFVAGFFTSIGGVPRTNIASFDISGALPVLEAWAPSLTFPAGVTPTVIDLLPVSGVVLVTGTFDSIGGVPSHGLAAIDARTARPLPWAPSPTWLGRWTLGSCLDVSVDRVWVTGGFTAIDGVPRVNAAAFDFSGALTSWRAPIASPLSVFEYCGAIIGNRLHMGRRAFELDTGDDSGWTPDLDGAQVGDIRWTAVAGLGAAMSNGEVGFLFYPRVELPAVSGLSGTAAGNRIDLTWSAVAGAMSYVVDVGSAAGLRDVASFSTGSSATTFSAEGPNGIYYLRVRAKTGLGLSRPSSDLRVALGPGACAAPPSAPLALSGGASTNYAVLRWSAPASGGAPERYIVDVRATTGGPLIAQLDNGHGTIMAGAAPSGTYFVRVRAENACGSSPASEELRLVVP